MGWSDGSKTVQGAIRGAGIVQCAGPVAFCMHYKKHAEGRYQRVTSSDVKKKTQIQNPTSVFEHRKMSAAMEPFTPTLLCPGSDFQEHCSKTSAHHIFQKNTL